MFVATYTSKQNGKTYTSSYLVESYRNEQGQARQRRLLNISHLPPEKILSIKAALQGRTLVDWESIEGLQALDFGIPFLTLKTLEKLGFPGILPPSLQEVWPTLAAMIINRLDAPKAKYGLKHWVPRTATARLLEANSDAFAHQNACYKTLDRLENAQTTIEDALFSRRTTPPTLFLYDLTSTYFEGEKAELAAYGYSRDHRSDRKQVTIGLLGDSNGLPIAVEVFRGNTRDSTTVLAQIRKMTKRFGTEKACFVGDRGMMTVENAELLRKENLDFILALTHREVLGLVEQHGPQQMGLFDEKNMADLVVDGRRLVVCRNPIAGSETKRRRDKLMALTEERLKKLALRIEAGRLKKAAAIQRALDRFIGKWGMEKFYEIQVADEAFSWKVDDKKLEAAARLDGVYVLESTQKVEDVSGEKIQSVYKNLQVIERAFKCLKSELRVRPVFHWRERRIRGHIFLCMLSYLVEQTWRLSWDGWPSSGGPEWNEILSALRGWRRVYAPGGRGLRPKDAGLTVEVVKFLNLLGISLP